MQMPQPNQHDGPMEGHVHRRRVFTPPLAATGVLVIGDWFKDDLPDMLWPALVLAEQGNDAIRSFVSWQKAVQDALSGHDETALVAESLDGRLTNLARLAIKIPSAAAVVSEQADEHGLLSAGVRSVLTSYPYMPVPWLTANVEVHVPDQADIDLVRRALLESVSDGHREALMKCFHTWSTVQAGTFSSDQQTIDLLKAYPDEEESRSQADTVIRSQWGAHKGMLTVEDPSYFDEAIKWARVFWGANSMTSQCVRKRETDSETTRTPASDGSSLNDTHVPVAESQGAGATAPPQARPDPDSKPDALDGPPAVVEDVGANATLVPPDGAHLRGLTMDLLSSFVEALETAPARLHDKERQEVVSGLVSRAGRDLIAVLTAPDLWCMEHGAHIVRMLVETKIYLHWMAQQDPAIYREFQEYGAGKAKLYARIADEVPAEARTPGYQEAIDELERLSHNHDIIDYRIVDTRDTFARGKSIRSMADETGLLDFYRQAYSQASGVAHSEWWSIETHAMERCLNVLHGLHLIPSLSLSLGGNVQLATAWVNQFYSLVRTAFRILGTDERAVSSAFSWLEESENEETA
ncbi:hypothetical protein KM427_18955 [Nocardioides sp. LMS-CY]|uniref:DUF5677 domain-containing protein n=1 Tax=Nocardioides sp. (strain LMS-CY) TaxID=2840457 RepID=UPI001C00384B|nr:DUF5677 domain-containing protein [Nocardioides sp. LMS-CY]QWF21013.1 hypothetical protein KM427_18955 [Nocardioides sp. LMS-CY]